MYEIPKPELLDPDRVNRDDREDFTAEEHRSQAQLLATALGDSCAYADQLWNQLNLLRGYLLDSLPPDPLAPGPHTNAAASPTGPDDDEGWLNWVNAFATTTSVLCGSHGDSGFGLSRAREEARMRRTGPVLTRPTRHPDLGGTQPLDPRTQVCLAEQETTPGVHRDADHGTDHGTAGAYVKAAVATVIGILALRGLRNVPPTRRAHDAPNNQA